jgi:hypothetical protein
LKKARKNLFNLNRAGEMADGPDYQNFCGAFLKATAF